MVRWPWAGRVDVRHGMMAACVLLGGVLATGGSLMTGGCASLDERVVLRAGSMALIVANDTDGDGALSRAEVTAMVERAVPPATRVGGGWDVLRAWLVAAYMAGDANGDGRLTPVEVGPAERACADADGDGSVSDAEAAAALGRCPAGLLPALAEPDYAAANRAD